MCCAERQEADCGAAGVLNFGLWHVFPRGVVLLRYAVHVPLVVVRPFAVERFFVMAATSSEVWRQRMFRARQCAVGDTVAITITIALELAQTFEILGRQHLSSVKLFSR